MYLHLSGEPQVDHDMRNTYLLTLHMVCISGRRGDWLAAPLSVWINIPELLHRLSRPQRRPSRLAAMRFVQRMLHHAATYIICQRHGFVRALSVGGYTARRQLSLRRRSEGGWCQDETPPSQPYMLPLPLHCGHSTVSMVDGDPRDHPTATSYRDHSHVDNPSSSN